MNGDNPNNTSYGHLLDCVRCNGLKPERSCTILCILRVIVTFRKLALLVLQLRTRFLVKINLRTSRYVDIWCTLSVASFHLHFYSLGTPKEWSRLRLCENFCSGFMSIARLFFGTPRHKWSNYQWSKTSQCLRIEFLRRINVGANAIIAHVRYYSCTCWSCSFICGKQLEIPRGVPTTILTCRCRRKMS